MGSIYSLYSHFLLPHPAIDISKMVAALEILWFDCGLAWMQIIGSEFDHIRHLMPPAEQCMPVSMVARCTTALTGDRILQNSQGSWCHYTTCPQSIQALKPQWVTVPHQELLFQLLESWELLIQQQGLLLGQFICVHQRVEQQSPWPSFLSKSSLSTE